jgi:hypothetical protein
MQFLWGANRETTLQVGGLYELVTDRIERAGSEHAQSPGGAEDSWRTGADYSADLEAQFIPHDDSDTSRSPWSGSTGWQAFLDYARTAGTFRIVPDSDAPDFYVDDCYLYDPYSGGGSLHALHRRRFPFKVRHPTVDLHAALMRGLMFEYAPGGSLTDPVAATFARATAATFRGLPGGLQVAVGASAASGVLRDRHYEGALKTTLLEAARTQLVTDPENFGNWTLVNTLGRTGGQADPFGGTAAYLIEDNDGALLERMFQVVTFTANATKTVSVFMRQGSSTVHRWGLFDETAGVYRRYVEITWTAGVPSMAHVLGTGTLFPVENWGGGWWRFSIAADGVVAANANRFFLQATIDDIASTGTLYVFGANAWNATFPSSYQGPSLGTRNADLFNWSFTHRPQAMFALVEFIERGGSHEIAGATRLLGTDAGSDDVRFMFYNATTKRWQFTHDNGPDFVGAGMTQDIAIGQTVALLGIIAPTGAVTLKWSLDGGAEQSNGPSAAAPFASAWTSQLLRVAMGDTQTASEAYARIKVGPLTFAGVERSTIALARKA